MHIGELWVHAGNVDHVEPGEHEAGLNGDQGEVAQLLVVKPASSPIGNNDHAFVLSGD